MTLLQVFSYRSAFIVYLWILSYAGEDYVNIKFFVALFVLFRAPPIQI